MDGMFMILQPFANFQGYDIAMIPWITAETYADTMNFIKNTSAQVAMGHLKLKDLRCTLVLCQIME